VGVLSVGAVRVFVLHMVYVLKWCMYWHGVCTSMVYVLAWCTVCTAMQCDVFLRKVDGSLCTVELGLQFDFRGCIPVSLLWVSVQPVVVNTTPSITT